MSPGQPGKFAQACFVGRASGDKERWKHGAAQGGEAAVQRVVRGSGGQGRDCCATARRLEGVRLPSQAGITHRTADGTGSVSAAAEGEAQKTGELGPGSGEAVGFAHPRRQLSGW
ncbi:hypothetical protein NDU88_002561 [Pleurodeles waltl]|uniref:Uncharacterized protein n=1 Tax=Pleurodeles waltl TaxID=8319 RepID=A0AAV7TNL2_PLEWA|nr:hypothetical protein NDU88_002561 [Pleurodeles waltl]